MLLTWSNDKHRSNFLANSIECAKRKKIIVKNILSMNQKRQLEPSQMKNIQDKI